MTRWSDSVPSKFTDGLHLTDRELCDTGAMDRKARSHDTEELVEFLLSVLRFRHGGAVLSASLAAIISGLFLSVFSRAHRLAGRRGVPPCRPVLSE
jgi:pantothenate kinase